VTVDSWPDILDSRSALRTILHGRA